MSSGKTVFLQRSAARDDFVAWADLLKVLAHPSRLMIIEALSRGELCVRRLTALVGHDMSTVSKHLKLLRENGIVEDDKRGKQVYCRLRIPSVLHIFYYLESVRNAEQALTGLPPDAEPSPDGSTR